MIPNEPLINQCPNYIGAQKDKIGNTYKAAASAIYCLDPVTIRCLYQLTADRKSSIPRSGRWMTAFFLIN